MTDQAFAQKYLFEWHEWPSELQAGRVTDLLEKL